VSPAANGLSHITITQSDRSHGHDDQLSAQVHFIHPVDRARDHLLTLSAQGQGVYAGDVSLEKGHWGIELNLMRAAQLVFRSENQMDISANGGP
jgi:nitrogen fixation protein FixH